MRQRHNQQALRRILIGLIGWMCLNVGGIPQLFAEEASLSEIKTGKVILSWDELKKLLEEIETLKQDIKTLKQEQTQTKQKQEEPLPVEYSITESHLVEK